MKRYQMLIGGEWVDAAGGADLRIREPVPRQPVGADAAGHAGRCRPRGRGGVRRPSARPGWRRLSASARGALLRRFGDLVAREADRLAEIEVRDNGKLIAEMRAQLRYLPQWFHYFGGLADKIEGAVIPIDKPGVLQLHARGAARRGARRSRPGTRRCCWRPGSSRRRWPPATPWSSSRPSSPRPRRSSSASCSRRPGFPPGVVNVVTGFGAEVGDAAGRATPRSPRSPSPAATRPARRVYELAARAHQARSRWSSAASRPTSCSTTPISTTRSTASSPASSPRPARPASPARALLVQAAIHDEFVERLLGARAHGRAWATRCDDDDPGRADHDAAAVREGARLHRHRQGRGRQAACSAAARRRGPECGDGLVRRADHLHRRRQPTCASRRRRCSGRCCRSSRSTTKRRRSRSPTTSPTASPPASGPQTSGARSRMAERLEAGTVWVNTYRAVSFMSPFGGYKRSGIGRESGAERDPRVPADQERLDRHRAATCRTRSCCADGARERTDRERRRLRGLRHHLCAGGPALARQFPGRRSA